MGSAGFPFTDRGDHAVYVACSTLCFTKLSLEDALQAAEKTAEQGMLSTVPLVAKKGRASYLGERSAGTQDPGATSSYFLLKTAAHALRSPA